MSRLRLRFPYQQQSVPQIDFAILFIGLLILAGVLLQFRQITEEVNYWNNRVERLEKQQQQKAAPRIRSTPRIREFSQEIRKEITQANAILDQINFPGKHYLMRSNLPQRNKSHYYRCNPMYPIVPYVSAARPRICRSYSTL